MLVFKNFFVVIVLIGLLTRVANYFFQKKMKKLPAAYASFIVVGVIAVPLASYFVGFDVMATEYVFSLILWLIFDLLRANVEKKKGNKE